MTVGRTSFSFPVLKAGVIIVRRVLHCSPLASLSIELVMLSLSIVCKRKKKPDFCWAMETFATFSHFYQCIQSRNLDIV